MLTKPKQIFFFLSYDQYYESTFSFDQIIKELIITTIEFSSIIIVSNTRKNIKTRNQVQLNSSDSKRLLGDGPIVVYLLINQ